MMINLMKCNGRVNLGSLCTNKRVIMLLIGFETFNKLQHAKEGQNSLTAFEGYRVEEGMERCIGVQLLCSIAPFLSMLYFEC